MTGATGPLVSGTANQTLYHNGSTWTASSNLSNDGTTVSTDADIIVNYLTVGHGAATTPMVVNTVVGMNALESNTTGYSNTAIGYKTLKDNSTGSENTGLGRSALYENTTGKNNVAIGDNALHDNTSETTIWLLEVVLKFKYNGSIVAVGSFALFTTPLELQHSIRYV